MEAFRDSILFVSGALDVKIGGKPVDLKSKENVRRTLYGNIHRRDLDKMLQVFDFPDPAAHGASRSETTTPLQVLFSLNSPFILEQSEILAKRVSGEGDPVTALYRLLFQRVPSSREKELADRFLATPENTLSLFSHALLCSNEFLYLD